MSVAGYSLDVLDKGFNERVAEMSSNYPEGSMRGSGIYAEDYTGIFYCSDCEDEFELDGQTDDWGTYAYADCPDCGKGLELEMPDNDEPDPDAMYEAWKDQQRGH